MADDDSAGPLLGWSIGNGFGGGGPSSGAGRPIEDLVKYPCVFRFKAVAKADVDVVKDLVARVAGVIGSPVEEGAWSTRESSGGKYVSLTIDVHVTTAEQVYAVYEALRADARVTHLL